VALQVVCCTAITADGVCVGGGGAGGSLCGVEGVRAKYCLIGVWGWGYRGVCVCVCVCVGVGGMLSTVIVAEGDPGVG